MTGNKDLLWDVGIIEREIARQGITQIGEARAYALRRAAELDAERWLTPSGNWHGSRPDNNEFDRLNRIYAWRRYAREVAA